MKPLLLADNDGLDLVEKYRSFQQRQNQIVKDFGEFTPDKVTVEELGVNNSIAIKLMKDAGWD